MPFWEECQADLGADRAAFEEAAELCHRSHPSLAQQLNVECTDGTPEYGCVPRCAEEYHGYQLLLNIGGETGSAAGGSSASPDRLARAVL